MAAHGITYETKGNFLWFPDRKRHTVNPLAMPITASMLSSESSSPEERRLDSRFLRSIASGLPIVLAEMQLVERNDRAIKAMAGRRESPTTLTTQWSLRNETIRNYQTMLALQTPRMGVDEWTRLLEDYTDAANYAGIDFPGEVQSASPPIDLNEIDF